jgi:chorismate mutase / prephenate dehydratase
VTLPHLGRVDPGGRGQLRGDGADQLRDFLENGNIRNSVNFPEAVLPRESGHLPVAIANENVPNMVGQISTAIALPASTSHDLLNKSRGEICVHADRRRRRGGPGAGRPLRGIEGVLSARIVPREAEHGREQEDEEAGPQGSGPAAVYAARPRSLEDPGADRCGGPVDPRADQPARGARARKVGISKHQDGHVVDYYRPEREAQVLRGVIKAQQRARCAMRRSSGCSARSCLPACAGGAAEGRLPRARGHVHPAGRAQAFRPLGARTVARRPSTRCSRRSQAGNADFGVVPVENSTEGTISNTLDMLPHAACKICGEVELRIHHNLMGRMKAPRRDRAHLRTPAGARPVPRLARRKPARRRARAGESATPRGRAARATSAGRRRSRRRPPRRSTASHHRAATSRTARQHHAVLVIGRKLLHPSGQDKTTLIVSARRRRRRARFTPARAASRKHGISLTRIESRPSRRRQVGLRVFIDIEGHAEEPAVGKALEALKSRAASFRILGSYPRAVL